MSACKLDKDTYEFWNEIAGRDVAYPELSKNGIQSTKYDIKNQLAIFKKGREKIEYVSKFKNAIGKDIKTEVKVNCQSPTQFNNTDTPLITEN